MGPRKESKEEDLGRMLEEDLHNLYWGEDREKQEEDECSGSDSSSEPSKE